MLIRAILLSLLQLADRQTFAILLRVVALTLLIFLIAGGSAWWAADRWLLHRAGEWRDGAEALLALGLLVAGWFLFRAVAMGVMGLFSDGVVASVEVDHYPADAAAAVPVPFAKGLKLGLRSAMRAIGWNLLAAPLYLVLALTGIGLPIALLIVNGALLGRDLETMVRARHPGRAPLPAAERWKLGLVTAAAFLIPIANLLAPIFGAALAVHLFHLPRKDIAA